MPWLAVPFEDDKQRRLLGQQFKVAGIPALVIVGGDGKVLPPSKNLWRYKNPCSSALISAHAVPVSKTSAPVQAPVSSCLRLEPAAQVSKA
jgi:hypothetical protein